MATTYYRRSYNQRGSITYTIKFYEHQIDTTVTKDPDVVSAWIYQTEQIYHRHLKRLIVGLDTEWRLCFNNGKQSSKVAIMQICIGTRCLVFQIIHSSVVPPCLIKFMNNPNYTFTGVGVYDDVVKLRNEYGLGYEARVMDLGRLAEKVYGPSSNKLGLKRLTDLVLDKVLEKPKRITLSLWDRYMLSYEQVEYACLDAFVSFEIARILLAKTSTIVEPRLPYMHESMFRLVSMMYLKYPWRLDPLDTKRFHGQLLKPLRIISYLSCFS